MSESKAPSNSRTVFFVVILCLVCALILAVLASVLRAPQAKARELDTAKQILAAAHIYDPLGYFLLPSDDKEGEPAKYDASKGELVPGSTSDKAEASAIYAVFQSRIKPYLTNRKGDLYTFEEAGLDQQEYIAAHEKTGYTDLPNKLVYQILPNYSTEENPTGEGVEPIGYIIPANGLGLWGPIYGYLALEKNGDTVIGISWYAPAETPGLGAIIQDPNWQAQFPGKEVFLPAVDGATNYEKAPLGIVVVKGKVRDMYGDSPRSKTAVDGITGATLTGDGVTNAYKNTLAAYRPFLAKLAEDKPVEEE